MKWKKPAKFNRCWNKSGEQRCACIRHIDDHLHRGHSLVESLKRFNFLSEIFADGFGHSFTQILRLRRQVLPCIFSSGSEFGFCAALNLHIHGFAHILQRRGCYLPCLIDPFSQNLSDIIRVGFEFLPLFAQRSQIGVQRLSQDTLEAA
jgi:hypothetical protein